ncbi:MAG: hypothetical protein JXB88_07565 [Spirochaetales bacterium]|nr:hypothetical protein [Spirochaetales bacterium]
MIKKNIALLLIPVIFLFIQCLATERVNKQVQGSSRTENGKTGNETVFGFGILERIPGLWNGPVTSSTPAGSFDRWYVDFRPVSPGQVSQYSTLDAQTVNYMSFFIVKHNNQLKVALRTEGVFQNKGCVTYEVMDTVKESEGYYRFSDFQAGEKRAFTEFTFKPDEFLMEVYTNKFNKVFPLQLHSQWRAKLGDRSAALNAVSHFKFPQPLMVKDFSHVFDNMTESIYFTFENDPYSSLSQPYVGTVTVTLSIDKELKVNNNHELFLLLTTGSLYEGLKYKEENLKYISKYVYLPVSTKQYTFSHVHPGTYYLYSHDDVNGDKKYLKGDYISSDINNIVTLQAGGNVSIKTNIDFIIP